MVELDTGHHFAAPAESVAKQMEALFVFYHMRPGEDWKGFMVLGLGPCKPQCWALGSWLTNDER